MVAQANLNTRKTKCNTARKLNRNKQLQQQNKAELFKAGLR